MEYNCSECSPHHSAQIEEVVCACACHGEKKIVIPTEYTANQVLEIAEKAIKILREELTGRIVTLEKGYSEIYSKSISGPAMNFVATTIMQGINPETAQARDQERQLFESEVMVLMKRYKVLATDIKLLANL